MPQKSILFSLQVDHCMVNYYKLIMLYIAGNFSEKLLHWNLSIKDMYPATTGESTGCYICTSIHKFRLLIVIINFYKGSHLVNVICHVARYCDPASVSCTCALGVFPSFPLPHTHTHTHTEVIPLSHTHHILPTRHLGSSFSCSISKESLSCHS